MKTTNTIRWSVPWLLGKSSSKPWNSYAILGGQLPTARKWVSSPQWEIHGIFVGLIHWNHWGELTHLLSGMNHQVWYIMIDSINHMVNLWLVGGAITILKNDGVRQWEGWHPIYEMENKKCSKPPTRVVIWLPISLSFGSPTDCLSLIFGQGNIQWCPCQFFVIPSCRLTWMWFTHHLTGSFS